MYRDMGMVWTGRQRAGSVVSNAVRESRLLHPQALGGADPAGGSANYGGRYGVIHPYSQTDRPDLAWTGSDNKVYTGERLHGLDSIRHVRAFFEKRALDLGRCEPDDALVSDPDGATGTRSPKSWPAADGRSSCITRMLPMMACEHDRSGTASHACGST